MSNSNQDLRDVTCDRYCLAPKLIEARLGDTNVLERMTAIYGKERGWNCRLWKGSEIAGPFEGTKEFYFKFINDQTGCNTSKVGTEHIMKGSISLDDVFNPLWTVPCGSVWTSKSGI